ncbi:DVU_1557 family redox protein [Uliginosibacterium gangwonense]|uniref:DVU_1557 family redox protein n=1 Tax=Uliginosibacterium gangwonense TaxID=392736 RepID=UPI00036E8E75|nr:CLJU_RS11820 family redox protein [Uliginosibacterium gangwonense]
MSSIPPPSSQKEDFLCIKCEQALVLRKVNASYLGSSFQVDLLCCPSCGFVYVPEALALGKMLQVEQALEDK